MLDSGFITLIVILSVLLAVGLPSWAIVFYTRRKNGNTGWDDTGWLIPAILSAFFLACIVLISAFALYPYNMKYVTWVHKEGIVASVAPSADSDSGAVDGLRITLGDGTVFVTSDFGLAQVREGQRVELSCLPRPHGSSLDTYKCVTGGK